MIAKSIVLFILIFGLPSSCSAVEHDITENEFYSLMVSSRMNSAQSFRLIREDENSYLIEEKSSPFHKKMLRIKKERLVITCPREKPPCVIKEKFVTWKK